MRALATIALGITEIMLDRSVLQLRLTAESAVLRLGLMVICGAIALASAGFYLAVLYDLSAAAWGPIPAKLVLGSLLACATLALSLVIVQSGARSRRWTRRI